MSRGRMLKYLVLPVLVALGVTFAAYTYLAGAQPAQAIVETVPVVVAREPLPARTELTAEMVEVRPFPKEYLVAGSLQDTSQVVGRVTTAPFAAGEPVLESRLAAPGNQVGLAYHVPEGYRALTLPLNEISGVAGFLQPGDRVDVIATFSDSEKFPDAPVSRYLLENLHILAIGQTQEVRSPAGQGRLDGYSSITLAVTPEEAVRLTLAAENASLRFVLRPAIDDGGRRGPARTTLTDLDS